MSMRRMVTYKYGIMISVMASIVSIFILRKFWYVLYRDDMQQYRYMANYAIMTAAWLEMSKD